jgi:hypothetical protein
MSRELVEVIGQICVYGQPEETLTPEKKQPNHPAGRRK